MTPSFLPGYRGFVARWRAIILLVILAVAAFLIANTDFFDLFLFALLLIFIASQLFWIGHFLDLGQRYIPGKPRRACWPTTFAALNRPVLTFSVLPTIGCTGL